MTSATRNTAFAALLFCNLAPACSPAGADATDLHTIDSLITATDAAMLTLNELDRGRYHRADSLYTTWRTAFGTRFQDTLDRRSADLLGNEYLLLRAAHTMDLDHERVMLEVSATAQRLRDLRTDLGQGAIPAEEGRSLVAHEQLGHTRLLNAVHAVIANYRSMQTAWERRDTVEQLLTEASTARTAP